MEDHLNIVYYPFKCLENGNAEDIDDAQNAVAEAQQIFKSIVDRFDWLTKGVYKNKSGVGGGAHFLIAP